jgi:class 3 adenylate cyclase
VRIRSFVFDLVAHSDCKGMERRLAAVLIADVAGYGRLSQVDEEGTRAQFQADLGEIFEPQIAAHQGRLVKTMGDGLLVEFHSVVDGAPTRPRRWSMLVPVSGVGSKAWEFHGVKLAAELGGTSKRHKLTGQH